MQGVEEKNMSAIVETFNLNDYYFPTIFPLKQTKFLTWKTLKTKIGLHIAADLIARGARLSEKARNVVERIEGDIPKIGIERKMTETELQEYQQLVALADGQQDLVDLVEAWADDMQFCWNGAGARIEWMALHQMSHAGKLKVTSENNNHVVSEYDADYAIPADQKMGVAAKWKGNPTNAKPFSVDFKKVVKASRASSKGAIRLKHVWMSQDTFNSLVETAECQKLCASYVANALSMQTTPDLAAVNSMMAKLPYLYGLQLHVIDQDITFEAEDGTQTSGNPFAENVCLFTENVQLGNTWWVTPVDASITGTAATKVMRQYCLLKKFANEDPVEEVTQGICNAFPGWAGSERSYSLDVYNSTWNEGKE